MDSLCGEPVCLWLPEKLRAGKSEYVQGVEVAPDYKGIIPEGFDVIDLPECDYLMFQGEPFAEEDFEEAITAIWESEKKYDPSVVGYKWDKENPRIQLEPRGERGYIELVAVKSKFRILSLMTIKLEGRQTQRVLVTHSEAFLSCVQFRAQSCLRTEFSCFIISTLHTA